MNSIAGDSGVRIVGLLLRLGNDLDGARVGERRPGDGRGGKSRLRSRIGEVGEDGDGRSVSIEGRGDGDGEGDDLGVSSYIGGGTKDAFRVRGPSLASSAA